MSSSFSLFAFAIVCLLSAVIGQNQTQPGNGNLDIEDGYVWADVLTDGIAVLTGGDISADTLTLTGRLVAGDTELKSLTASDLLVADLWTSGLDASTGRITGLEVLNPALFGGDVTISGHLRAGAASLGATKVTTLEVEGQADVQGVVFAQTDVEVQDDLNVGGVARLFGDVMADMSLTVEGMLTVKGSANAESFQVKGLSQTQDFEALDLTTKDLWVQNLNVDGNLDVMGDISSEGDLMVGETVSAKSLNTDAAVTVQGNMTVDGWLFGQAASISGNVNATGWERVHGSLTVEGDSATLSDFYTNSSLAVVGDITGAGSVLSDDSDFTDLTVDTSAIESITATFVTATTLEAQDATAQNTFVVQGQSTLQTLHVIGASEFSEVDLVSLVTMDLNSETATTEDLNSTIDATLTTVEVAVQLLVGSPQNSTATANFQSTFSDNVTAVTFMGSFAAIDSIIGDSANIDQLTAVKSTIDDVTGQMTTISELDSHFAEIKQIQGDMAFFTTLDGETAEILNISATEADILRLISNEIVATLLDADSGDVNSTTIGNFTTGTLQATNGTLMELHATAGTIGALTGTNATVTTLTLNQGTLTNLWGQNLRSGSATIRTNLMSNTHNSVNSLLNGFDTAVLYAYVYSNISDANIRKLRVTESSWINSATQVLEDLQVEGFISLQEGIIAGDAVVAALTVVGDTLISSVSVTGPAFLTDLDVKRMTITDTFETTTASIETATIGTLTIEDGLLVGGTFTVGGDSRLGGNLVVNGTTQFQTGSFSRIGTALLTTTDMEVFNMNVASGLFGGLTVDDLQINRAAEFQRSIQLAPLLSSTSGGSYSILSSIVPADLTAIQDGQEIPVQAATVLHTGDATIDALVFTAANDSTVATLRITGDGFLDFLGGTLNFDELDIQGGIVFENENNVAWVRSDAIPTANLARGASAPFYAYSDLIDRDLVPPGQLFDPTRFSSPSNSQDLLTLSGGHYRISGSIYFVFNSAATASSRIVADVGIDAYSGTQSSSLVMWTTECRANFQSIAGSVWGGSCSFDDILVVDFGETMTLRTFAQWSFSSLTLSNTLRVDPRSTILIEELFERASQTA